MANKNAPSGAKLIGHLYGSTYNARVRPYLVPATDSIALYVGDFIKMTGSGGITKEGLTLPSVTQAEAEDTLTGVIVGFTADPAYLSQIYRSASTERTAFVCDDPYAVFEIQTNGVATFGDFGSNADIVLGTPNPSFGTSGTQLDQSSVTPSAAQIRIMGLSQRIDNEIGQYAKFICMINEHIFKQLAGI